MTQTNYDEFQELVEPFEPEMSLKAICEQEGVCYCSYISWRKTTNRILPCISKLSMKYSLLNSSVTSQYFSRCCPIQ